MPAILARNSFAKGALQNHICRFESCMPSQPVRSLLFDFWPCENRRHSRGLGWRAGVSGWQILEFRLWTGGFVAPVSGRHFPISVSGYPRPVRYVTETGLPSRFRACTAAKVERWTTPSGPAHPRAKAGSRADSCYFWNRSSTVLGWPVGGKWPGAVSAAPGCANDAPGSKQPSPLVANLFRSRRQLEVENLFLRHQLNIALRGAPRLRLHGSVALRR
jgi:hypothetical protein